MDFLNFMKYFIVLTSILNLGLSLFSQEKDFKDLKPKGEVVTQHCGIGKCTTVYYSRTLKMYEQTPHSYLFIPNEKQEEKFAEETKVWNGQEIHVYPNPAKENINIEFIHFNGKTAYLRISNMNGSELLKEKIKTDKNLKINISHLPAGRYYLTVFQTNKDRAGISFIKE